MVSIFPSEMMTKKLSLEVIIGKLTYFQEQVHLIHWQTSSYAEHKATGNLYEYIQSFKDDLVEKLMGYMNKKPTVFKIEPLTNCSSMDCISKLLVFASELKAFGEENMYHDVCNLADELSGKVAKTKYLLSLK